MPDKTDEAVATPKGAEGGTTPKRESAEAKPRRGHGEKALASIRAAKRGQREVSDPADRARFLLAEANVLALLEVADALVGSDGESRAGAADTAGSE